MRGGESESAGPPPNTSAVEPPSEERYALAMQSINYGVYDWDIETGAIYFAPALRAMLGLAPDEPGSDQNWRSRIHPDDREHYRQTMIAHLKGDLLLAQRRAGRQRQLADPAAQLAIDAFGLRCAGRLGKERF